MPTSPPSAVGEAEGEGSGARSASSARVLVALLVAAFNLRLAIGVVGPIIDDIQADLGMSSAVVGLLTAIPFLCMGAFAFLGPGVVERRGTRWVLALALVLIGVGTLVRAAMPTSFLLIVTTLPIGLGIALGGVVIPIVLKQYFASRPGTVTGAYTTALSAGIVVVGLTAVPLSDSLGSWRDVFALTALPAFVALPLWLATRVDDHRVEPAEGVPVAPAGSGMRPSRIKVLLGVLFGLQSICFAAVVTWGAAVYEEAGWAAEDAALVVTMLGVLTIVASLTVPPLSDRGDRRRWLVAMAVLMALGILGMATVPGDYGLVWMILVGFGNGALLPLCFALPLDLGSTPAKVGELTAWMLGIGHSMAALGPMIVGPLHELTDGFRAGLLVLFGLIAFDVFLATRVPRAARATATA
jgi:MFS transporter, CP family, cyanate transporter